MSATIDVSDATILAPGGRPLFDRLTLRLSRERVALIGRNGVGKSTLLAALAGDADVQSGSVRTRGMLHHVPQSIRSTTTRPLSHGELRRAALSDAKDSGADILLLDEPTEDLDEASVSWLRRWLADWRGCLVVASHDRRLLEDFRHFLVASESGCRYFCGTLLELEAELERDRAESQARYVRNLHRLAAQEEHTAHVARRKARKKRYGRCTELDRGTSRQRLNPPRGETRVGHGRLANVHAARLDALRQWSKSTRRALGVRLAMELPAPALPSGATNVLVLHEVSARGLFESLDLRLARQRVAVVGPNGAGKTTLLEIMLGRRAPSAGSVVVDRARVGAIAQGGADWMLDESLLAYLSVQHPARSADKLAQLLVAHKFPLALAERPLRSLSPGERTRAALICLFRRSPAVEVLVLDEPTYSLDLLGQRAMAEALRAWPGGLVVASHDRAFLAAIGVEAFIELGGENPSDLQ